MDGLDKLSALPECAEGARRALIACAGDSSKQLQEVLVQHYLRHPDWQADYLALLGSKKTAQRSLAIRVLAGLDREKYRPALERALAAEKNAKVMDQLSALLKAPAAPADGGGQAPAELASQVLKGGKSGKSSGCWISPYPRSATETSPTRRLRRIRWLLSWWPTPSWVAWAAATRPPPSPPI